MGFWPLRGAARRFAVPRDATLRPVVLAVARPPSHLGQVCAVELLDGRLLLGLVLDDPCLGVGVLDVAHVLADDVDLRALEGGGAHEAVPASSGRQLGHSLPSQVSKLEEPVGNVTEDSLRLANFDAIHNQDGKTIHVRGELSRLFIFFELNGFLLCNEFSRAS